MQIPRIPSPVAPLATLAHQVARNQEAMANSLDQARTSQSLQQITEQLQASQETGDRDAQERYQGEQPPPPTAKVAEATTTEAQPSIWDLEVEDATPPSDLDILG
jgi:hypothetical protein